MVSAMSAPSKPTARQSRRWRSISLLLAGLCSLCLGWSLAIAAIPVSTERSTAPQQKSVDRVPDRYQLGQTLYLENCGSCHIALPPAIMPTETWRQLLQEEQHYGVQLQPLIDPPRLLVWQYLQIYSRPQLKDEPTPYRINSSRYFQALHPRVEFPEPVTLNSCASCHVGASEYDFRPLTPDWENST